MSRCSYLEIRREIVTRREGYSIQCIGDRYYRYDCPNDLWPEQIEDATELIWRADQYGVTLVELRDIINCLLCVDCQRQKYYHKDKIECSWRRDFPTLDFSTSRHRSPYSLVSGRRKWRRISSPTRSYSSGSATPSPAERRRSDYFHVTPPSRPRFISPPRGRGTTPSDDVRVQRSSISPAPASPASSSFDESPSDQHADSDDEGCCSEDEGSSESEVNSDGESDHELPDSPSAQRCERQAERITRALTAAENPVGPSQVVDQVPEVRAADEEGSVVAAVTETLLLDTNTNDADIDLFVAEGDQVESNDNAEIVDAVVTETHHVDSACHNVETDTAVANEATTSNCDLSIVHVDAGTAEGTHNEIDHNTEDVVDVEVEEVERPASPGPSHLFTVGKAFTWSPWAIDSRALSILLEPLPNGSLYAVPVRNTRYLKIGFTKQKVERRWSQISSAHKLELETNAGFHLAGVPYHELLRLESLVHAYLAYFQRVHRVGDSRRHREYFEIDLAVAERSIKICWQILQKYRPEPGRLLNDEFSELIKRAALYIETSGNQQRAISSENWAEVNSNHTQRESIWRKAFELDEDDTEESRDRDLLSKNFAVTPSWPTWCTVNVPMSLAFLAVGGAAFMLTRRKFS